MASRATTSMGRFLRRLGRDQPSVAGRSNLLINMMMLKIRTATILLIVTMVIMIVFIVP